MGYRTLRECLVDLERHGHLVRVRAEVDPYLELAEIQRRAYRARAPALWFERVKGSRYSAVGNLFGTVERGRFIFRDAFERTRRAIELRASPARLLGQPWRYRTAWRAAWNAMPRRVSTGAILAGRATIDQLPQIVNWPADGGAFVTLPQVITESAPGAGLKYTNIGMYRVQLSGGDYRPGRQVGLHCQIHRGLGVHLAAAAAAGRPLPVAIAVGGPPSLAMAAVMPLPEGLSECVLAGMLAGRRLQMVRYRDVWVPAEADFCIIGRVLPGAEAPEGPFGDHLGYYSLAHPFPVVEVEEVLCRRGAVWPFTVVGRPPQEDTTFGQLVHELAGPMVPAVLPGVVALHAVDAAGVHPLMLALARERYLPTEPREPREILTAANAILGFGQASLTKYLWIAAVEDEPHLKVADIQAFLTHVLGRVDWRRDLHFQTRTTIDTLDYSGPALHCGSKLVVAAAGPPRRQLARSVPTDLQLPPGFGPLRLALPGVLAVGGPEYLDERPLDDLLRTLAAADSAGVALVVVCDDPDFAARSLSNFLWVTFTRSNPSHDVRGVGECIDHKHWGCAGPLVIDARQKPHHAPPLVEDPAVSARVDALAAAGGPLHGVI